MGGHHLIEEVRRGFLCIILLIQRQPIDAALGPLLRHRQLLIALLALSLLIGSGQLLRFELLVMQPSVDRLVVRRVSNAPL